MRGHPSPPLAPTNSSPPSAELLFNLKRRNVLTKRISIESRQTGALQIVPHKIYGHQPAAACYASSRNDGAASNGQRAINRTGAPAPPAARRRPLRYIRPAQTWTSESQLPPAANTLKTAWSGLNHRHRLFNKTPLVTIQPAKDR
ncbi:hypothetical protein EVAR_54321_1 [Eumeta japonica]|uniref:Uncharacterized protein n=1 Tax=Eumeta variegata TaxID=151549 RepID=A0A4C1Y4H3_EUMVA|nr:hypothetical protein EVAR_54321_1 [Eumeta japonica]